MFDIGHSFLCCFIILVALYIAADRKKFKREFIFFLRRTKLGRDFIVKNWPEISEVLDCSWNNRRCVAL